MKNLIEACLEDLSSLGNLVSTQSLKIIKEEQIIMAWGEGPLVDLRGK